MAELRVDCLNPDERFLVRRFPELAGVPVILTIRRSEDGGRYVGGEGARISLIARGLAFAEADRRRNFAYLDIEEDLNVPNLEEAARTFGTRILRSYHNTAGTDTDLAARVRSMCRSGDEIVKVSVTANSTADVLNLLRAGRECPKIDKILISMGHYGTFSRILAEQFGSFLSYSYAQNEPDAPVAAPGQPDVQKLAELYRFRNISGSTGVYGVTGFPLKITGSPGFFNTVFKQEDIDAVYVPFPADSIDSIMELADELGIAGLSVTVPYKKAVIPFLAEQSPPVQGIRACNTLSRGPKGWIGTNTDIRGFSDSLLEFIGRTNLKRQRVAVIGAGGAAKAVASELYRLGAKVLILNRTVHRARSLASPYKFAWGGTDSRGIESMDRYNNIIIQATSVGMTGTGGDSPDHTDPPDVLEMYTFSGKETVMDLVYEPEMTPFLKRAARAGCRVINGYDMLIRQARYQYTTFTGKEFPEYLLTRVQFDRN
jgi:3-dehydroquinate dehydratase/shikimate dehydrogenase